MATPEWIKSFPVEEMRAELAREWSRLEAMHPEQARSYSAAIAREREIERTSTSASPERAAGDRSFRLLIGLFLGVLVISLLLILAGV